MREFNSLKKFYSPYNRPGIDPTRCSGGHSSGIAGHRTGAVAAIEAAKGEGVERRATTYDRRIQTVRSLFHGALHPRRRLNRRPADDQVFVLDWHDSGLFLLSMSIVLMSCVDAWFTLHLLVLGGEEVNWFMQALIQSDSGTFLAVKYASTGSGVIVLAALARFRLAGFVPVRRILEGLAGIYACLLIYEVYLLVEVAGARLT